MNKSFFNGPNNTGNSLLGYRPFFNPPSKPLSLNSPLSRATFSPAHGKQTSYCLISAFFSQLYALFCFFFFVLFFIAEKHLNLYLK